MNGGVHVVRNHRNFPHCAGWTAPVREGNHCLATRGSIKRGKRGERREAADRAVVRWSSAIIRKNRKFFDLEEGNGNMEYAGPLCEPNPPFLCAPLSRDRAFFFPFFFFFFSLVFHRFERIVLLSGKDIFFFFPLEFYRAEIERVTDQIDQQNLNFLLPPFFSFFFSLSVFHSKGIFIPSGKEIFSFIFFPRILFIYLLYHYYYFIYYNFLYQGKKSFLFLFSSNFIYLLYYYYYYFVCYNFLEQR